MADETVKPDPQALAVELEVITKILDELKVPAQMQDELGKVRFLTACERVQFLGLRFMKAMERVVQLEGKVSTAGKLVGPDGKPVS